MSNHPHPYRQTNALSKREYGLIVPKAIPDYKSASHRCNPPSFWTRLYRRFFGTPIREGSLYRCRCGKILVWEFEKQYDMWDWNETHPDMWINAGGTIESKQLNEPR